MSLPDGRIDAIRGTVAVERGPLVYCLESVDLPAGMSVDDVVIDVEAGVVDTDGVVTATGWIDSPARNGLAIRHCVARGRYARSERCARAVPLVGEPWHGHDARVDEV